MEEEIWKPIEGYEELYLISSYGRIWNELKNKIMNGYLNHGYLSINLRKNNTGKPYMIHRLVGFHFIPNPHNYPQINHKDECKTNNKVDNLEWCTSKYNNNYGTRNERISKKNKNKPKSYETKLKLSKAKMGKKASEETKLKMSEQRKGEKNPFYGKTHNNETKEKLREINLGKTVSEETKLKISESTKGEKNHFYGRHHTEESKIKLSESNKGINARGNNPSAKKVMCDGMIFDCAKDCADYYDINEGTMHAWLNGRHNIPQYFYNLGLRYLDGVINDKIQGIHIKESSSCKKVICNGIVFNSITSCAKQYNINRRKMNGWLLNPDTMPQKFKDLGLNYYEQEEIQMNNSKVLLLLIGASASGKTTLGVHLETLGVKQLVSHTTRQMRTGEINGETYYYITKEEFDNIDKLEQTYYAGNYYCLSRQEVERHKEDLVYCIVDSHGVQQILQNYGRDNVIVIYIDVSYVDMIKRMRNRGDSEEKIKERIKYAIETKEMERDIEVADYFIINTDIDKQKIILSYITNTINKLKKEMSDEEETIL